MRVLNIYSGNLYGGIETMLLTLARGQQYFTEMEMRFALCFEGRLFEELKLAGASVRLLGEVRAGRPRTVFKARKALSKVLAEEKIDAVVCHAPWSQAIFGPVVRAAGIPLVFWQHDAARGRHWLERWAAMTVPDFVICNSFYTAQTAANLYPQRIPQHVLYCPVEATAQSLSMTERVEVRARVETRAEAVVIIQVSRMEDWKGQEILLKALALMDDCTECVCWFVGGAQRVQEARYLKHLMSAAARLNVESRVRFLGERSDVPLLLGAADVFCQPNILPEPFGIAFVEALFAGLPVVATMLGGAKEIIDESCGRLVQPDEPEALALSLRQLVKEQSLRNSLSKNGPRRAAQLCDVENQMRELQSLLRGLMTNTLPDECVSFAGMA